MFFGRIVGKRVEFLLGGFRVELSSGKVMELVPGGGIEFFLSENLVGFGLFEAIHFGQFVFGYFRFGLVLCYIFRRSARRQLTLILS